MHLNSLDIVIRFVPNYGYLPLIVGHDRSGEKTREFFRGSFAKSPELAFFAATEILPQVATDEPPVEAFLERMS